MSAIAIPYQPTFERMIERIRRAFRALRVKGEDAERRRLVAMDFQKALARKPVR